MKKALLLFLFLFVLISPASARNPEDANGEDWAEYTDSMKVFFVNGFIAGSNFVANRAIEKNALLNRSIGGKEPFFTDLKLFLELNIKDLRNFQIYEMSVGQVVDGLDFFYREEANRKTKIIDAIYIVKKQLIGPSMENLEKMIFLRHDGGRPS